MIIFAIINLLKFVLFIVGLVVLGAVLIKAKKKRREQFTENLHQLFNAAGNDAAQKVYGTYGATQQPQQLTGNADAAAQFAAEQEALVNDPVRYRQYLEGVLARIPLENKFQLTTMFKNGQKAEAMREAQRISREGLRVVKDLCENYLIFPDLKYFTPRIYIKDASRLDIEASLRDYDGIYQGMNASSAYIGAIYGTEWNYVEFSYTISFDTFLNLLIWMSQKSQTIFAYAKPNGMTPPADSSAVGEVGNWADRRPFYATPDPYDGRGESCTGILNNKSFRFNVPGMTITYGDALQEGFDIEAYLKNTYNVGL
ncbi:MAG: hypothetical protein K5686_06435 [Lachnospiraceae bacterium]|nr:hypothetical protein [Lachnospiraceae bacterium]